MSILDVAGAARSQSAYVTVSALDAFPQFTDSDNYTRALAQRDSDGAVLVVYARGAVADIVSVHNERARLTHERGEASAELSKLADEFAPADIPADHPDAAVLREILGECEQALSNLPKTRAQLTLHVARALAHYERATNTEPEPEQDTEPEPTEQD